MFKTHSQSQKHSTRRENLYRKGRIQFFLQILAAKRDKLLGSKTHFLHIEDEIKELIAWSKSRDWHNQLSWYEIQIQNMLALNW